MQDGTASELVRASYVARQYLEDPTADLQELSINAAVLLTAGVDTTSSIIRMIMTRLAEEPEYQEDMLKEMEAIRGDRDPFGSLSLFSCVSLPHFSNPILLSNRI